jgi:hypothetical protein
MKLKKWARAPIAGIIGLVLWGYAKWGAWLFFMADKDYKYWNSVGSAAEFGYAVGFTAWLLIGVAAVVAPIIGGIFWLTEGGWYDIKEWFAKWFMEEGEDERD